MIKRDFTSTPIRPSEVRALLDELRVRPSKALGQNFLADANVLSVILDLIRLGPEDEILEIGPGLGALTGAMARTARRVAAVEKDRRLFAWLKASFREHAKIEIIHGDILTLDCESLLRSGVTKVVSNLPYSTGSAILVNFLKLEHPPEQMILTMQLEVAKRLVAPAGGPEFGLLSLWSQFRHHADILRVISPKCFYPAPGVRSAVVSLARHGERAARPAVQKLFFDITKFAFAQRRKQLKTLFRRLPGTLPFSSEQAFDAFRELGIDLRARPERLSADEWRKVAELMADCNR